MQTMSEWQPARVVRTMAVNAGIRVFFIFIPFTKRVVPLVYWPFRAVVSSERWCELQGIEGFWGLARAFSVFFVEGRYGVERILEGCVEKIKDFCKKKVDGRSIA